MGRDYDNPLSRQDRSHSVTAGRLTMPRPNLANTAADVAAAAIAARARLTMRTTALRRHLRDSSGLESGFLRNCELLQLPCRAGRPIAALQPVRNRLIFVWCCFASPDNSDRRLTGTMASVIGFRKDLFDPIEP